MEKILYVLIGLPCSGKSTYIKQHFSDNNHVIVSFDAVVEDWAQKEGKTYDQVWGRNFSLVKKICKEKYEKAIKEGKNIVIDNTNLKPKARALYPPPPGYKKIGIVFTTDTNTLQKRLIMRSKEQGKTIPSNVIEQMKNNFSYPSKSEGFEELRRVRT